MSEDRGLHLGFTGTQHGVTDAQRYSLLFVIARARLNGYEWMHNGDCRGADETAGEIWRSLGGKVWLHAPDRDGKRAFLTADRAELPKPYLERNRDIVEQSARMIATPGEMFEQLRSGTWSTIRHARRLGLPRTIIWPNGNMEHVPGRAAVEAAHA